MRAQTRGLVIGLLLVAFATGVSAQSGPPTVLYRLQPGSTYEEGCYNMCLCPILQAPLEGTFGLTILPTGGPLDTYAVDPVQFSVPALEQLLEGSGFYVRVGEMNELDLDLQANGEPARRFHSGGAVPAGAEFPDIDIVISVNQFEGCFDYSLHIIASPAAAADPTLAVDHAQLAWTPVLGSDGYDVVCGDLDALRSSSGDFTAATDACLGSDLQTTSMAYELSPQQGSALWFLVRDDAGSYDSIGPAQSGSRDVEIESSAPACP